MYKHNKVPKRWRQVIIVMEITLLKQQKNATDAYN